MTTAREFSRLLKTVRALVPLYKEPGEECMEFFRHVERKLSHEFGIHLGTTGIKCVSAGLIETFGSGVIGVFIGRHFDKLEWVRYGERRYDLTVKLGEARWPSNVDGELLSTKAYDHVTEEAIRQQVGIYKGVFKQRRPTTSDRKADESANSLSVSDEVEASTLVAVCHSIKLTRFEPPFFDLDVHCGANFNPRIFTEDLGTALGTVAHMTKLHRKLHGPFTVEDAIPSYAVSWKRLQEVDALHKSRVSEYSKQMKAQFRSIAPLLKPKAYYR